MVSSTKSPVEKGDIVSLDIYAINGKGEGLAKLDEFVIFVKGAKQGEKTRVLIKDVKRTYAMAEKI